MPTDDSVHETPSGQPTEPETAEQTDEAQPVERVRQAARAVMHPDPNDPEWRYYHGAWHS